MIAKMIVEKLCNQGYDWPIVACVPVRMAKAFDLNKFIGLVCLLTERGWVTSDSEEKVSGLFTDMPSQQEVEAAVYEYFSRDSLRRFRDGNSSPWDMVSNVLTHSRDAEDDIDCDFMNSVSDACDVGLGWNSLGTPPNEPELYTDGLSYLRD